MELPKNPKAVQIMCITFVVTLFGLLFGLVSFVWIAFTRPEYLTIFIGTAWWGALLIGLLFLGLGVISFWITRTLQRTIQLGLLDFIKTKSVQQIASQTKLEEPEALPEYVEEEDGAINLRPEQKQLTSGELDIEYMQKLIKEAEK